MTDMKLDPIRLSGWDFATWRSASEDPIMRSTMIGLLILDRDPDWDRLVDRYERASRVVPILRRRSWRARFASPIHGWSSILISTCPSICAGSGWPLARIGKTSSTSVDAKA